MSSSSSASVEDIVESFALLSPENDQVNASGIASLLKKIGYNYVDEDSIRIRLKSLHGKENLNIRDFVTLYKSGEITTQDLDARAIHSAMNLLLHIHRSKTYLEAAGETPAMTLTTSVTELAESLDVSGTSLLSDFDMTTLIEMGVTSKQKLGSNRSGKLSDVHKPSEANSAAVRLGFMPSQDVSIVSISNQMSQLVSKLVAPPDNEALERSSDISSVLPSLSEMGVTNSNFQNEGLDALSGRHVLASPSPLISHSISTISHERTREIAARRRVAGSSASSMLSHPVRSTMTPRPPSTASSTTSTTLSSRRSQ